MTARSRRSGLDPPPARYDGRLQLEEDPGFVRRECALQRVGWVLMAALCAAGLSGLLGAGPLARAGVAGAPSWSVRSERVVRVGRPTELRVELGAAPSGEPAGVQVWLALPSALDRLRVQGISPTPESVVASHDALVFAFAAPREPGPRVFALRWVAQRAGWLPLQVGCTGCEPIALRALVLP